MSARWVPDGGACRQIPKREGSVLLPTTQGLRRQSEAGGWQSARGRSVLEWVLGPGQADRRQAPGAHSPVWGAGVYRARETLHVSQLPHGACTGSRGTRVSRGGFSEEGCQAASHSEAGERGQAAHGCGGSSQAQPRTHWRWGWGRSWGGNQPREQQLWGESSRPGGRRGNLRWEPGCGVKSRAGGPGARHEPPALSPTLSLTPWVPTPMLPRFLQQPARPHHPRPHPAPAR